MKSILLLIVPALSATMLVSLAAGAVEKITMRTLTKGAFSGVTEAKQEVMKTQAAWDKFLAAHHANTKSAPQLPAVDFSKDMVIATTMGRKSSGGYSIEITGVETNANRLRISVKRTSPAPGAIVITALTAPFHFVAVPKSELKPEFVDAPTADKAK